MNIQVVSSFQNIVICGKFQGPRMIHMKYNPTNQIMHMVCVFSPE